MRHTVHIILLHPTDASVLALKRDARFALPSVNVESAWLGMSGPLNDAVLDSLDTDALVLRTRLLRVGRRRSEVESAALMRLRSPLWTPPAGSRWLAADDVAALPARMRAAVVDAISDRDVAHRAAWTRRGWYDEAAAWAIHALLDAGYRIDGAMEQVRHWSLSSIWRIPTKSGSTYSKRCRPCLPTRAR